MHHPTDRITHTTAFVTPVVEHWLEREIAQWVAAVNYILGLNYHFVDFTYHYPLYRLNNNIIQLLDKPKNGAFLMSVSILLKIVPCFATFCSLHNRSMTIKIQGTG